MVCVNDNDSNIGKFAYLENVLFVEFYFVNNEEKKIFLIAFGTRLREVREAKGFTQAKLANDLGIEISQISRMERGLLNTSVATLSEICKILKASPTDLIDF